MPEVKPAKLSAEALREIKALEERLGGVCLVAVEQARAMYAVEAKLGPNDWAPIHDVYPDIENLKSYYADRDDAAAAKAALKSLLVGRVEFRDMKKPIRVRSIESDGDN